MKKNLGKYIVIILIFVVGISLGSLTSSSESPNNPDTEERPPSDEDWIIIEEIEGNLFTRIAQGTERAINRLFSHLFRIIHNLISLVFGM
ncbi:MAG: hypothetical protein FWE36_04580 [Erysipelotrichales bacterium]|nr:hypothetical protein [Erysipelotrichales bacterium]